MLNLVRDQYTRATSVEIQLEACSMGLELGEGHLKDLSNRFARDLGTRLDTSIFWRLLSLACTVRILLCILERLRYFAK